MGGKRPEQRRPGPAGIQPFVRGPMAGANIVARITGPMNAQAARNRDSFKDTAAPIVGTIAGIVSDYFAPGTGFFASKAADRTVREQVNVINGRPFFEGVDNTPGWSDLAGVVTSGYGSTAASAINAGTTAGRVATQAVTTGLRMGAGYLDRQQAQRQQRQRQRRPWAMRPNGYLYGR